jgi:hypothetical protein
MARKRSRKPKVKRKAKKQPELAVYVMPRHILRFKLKKERILDVSADIKACYDTCH